MTVVVSSDRFTDTFARQILFAYEDERGEDVIEAIDFWKSQQRKSEMHPGDFSHVSPPSSSAGGSSRLGLMQ